MQNKVKKLSFKGKDIHVGIDVHLKTWVVTIIVEGLFYKTFSQDSNAKVLFDYLKRHFPEGNYYSVYEAGFCGFSVHRSLKKLGITNIIVNPADVPTTDKDRRQKEDKRDSRKLARTLFSGGLEGIYILTESGEELRSMVRYRKVIVKELVRNKNRIKSFLKIHGIKIPLELESSSKNWSSRFTKWLKSIKLQTEYGDYVLQDTIKTAEFLRQNLLKATREFRKLNFNSPYSSTIILLRSVPGVGPVAAITLLSELQTIDRFKTLDNLCSYVGLVPSTNSSGENEKTGRITRRSNKPLREIIIESAWVAIRHDPALMYSYSEYKKTMPANKAIIRIAKKLLNRIRYVLKSKNEYITSIV